MTAQTETLCQILLTHLHSQGTVLINATVTPFAYMCNGHRHHITEQHFHVSMLQLSTASLEFLELLVLPCACARSEKSVEKETFSVLLYDIELSYVKKSLYIFCYLC